jgi:hypothetical protein
LAALLLPALLPAALSDPRDRDRPPAPEDFEPPDFSGLPEEELPDEELPEEELPEEELPEEELPEEELPDVESPDVDDAEPGFASEPDELAAGAFSFFVPFASSPRRESVR